MSRADPSKTAAPILVTGTHRSGTTWVGDMLSLGPTVHYVHEPFAPMYERAWVRRPRPPGYLHQTAEDDGVFSSDLAGIVGLRPPWITIARRTGGLRNAVRVSQEAVTTSLSRRRGARALIKDPFALLMAEWLVARTEAEVVALVRHPAAFASSIKRLSWRLRAGWLLDQPSLIEGELAPFRPELEEDRRKTNDLIDHACLVWRVLNTVVLRYEHEHPDWLVLRYEDLARDPAPGFESLYHRLDVPWTSAIQQTILDRNAPRQGADVTPGRRGGTQRDSRKAMTTWVHRLTSDEVVRIRRQTADLADHWYSDEDWDVRASD